jgi:hypothetical protein
MRYRRLDAMLIGANPEKLAAAQRRPAPMVRVDYRTRAGWRASSGQVQKLMATLALGGGAIEAQDGAGDWRRIRDYMVKRGQASGCDQATGEWFAVAALREVR